MLNRAQREAVDADLRTPLVIIAPPGSGKTRCLIARMLRIVDETTDRICAITFTNKAANEMRERLGVEMKERGLAISDRIRVTTFHSLCFKLCLEQNWISRRASIWTATEQREILKQILKSHSAAGEQVESYHVRNAMELVQSGNSPSQYPDSSDEGAIIRQYKREKVSQNAIDFNDMINLTIENVKQYSNERNPMRIYDAVLVDEWQDTSAAQCLLLQLFNTMSMTVVGDPNQAIYGWRGADVKCWANLKQRVFKEEFKQVNLNVNYRSEAAISQLCQGLISANTPLSPMEKVLTVRAGHHPMQLVRCSSPDAEAEFVSLELEKLDPSVRGQCAILFRANPRGSVSRLFERALLKKRIAYRIVAGTEFYQLKLVKLIVSHLRLLTNPKDNLAFDTVLKPTAKKAGLQAFHQMASAAAGRRSFMETLMETQRWPTSMRNYVSIFVAVQRRFKRYRGQQMSLVDLASQILSDCRFKKGDGDEEVMEILTQQLSDHSSVEDFLATAALMNPKDKLLGNASHTVQLSTIHASKGLEFDGVFIVRSNERVIPSRQSLKQLKVEDNDSLVQEERRLMYVAMSRARHFLTATWTHIQVQNHDKSSSRSRFLDELQSFSVNPSLGRRSSSGFTTASQVYQSPRSPIALIENRVFHSSSSVTENLPLKKKQKSSSKKQASMLQFFGKQK